ncbi:hypothetical protein HYH03_009487 [Edaphochlamys debaryana]|uniref:Poly A polymerase head domain-containing protein n=1 Tax=Edaphochlamys debaryana TaxID=47281 RepID=A0A835Y770_9CHLO|nr:hypothetical protein HYH03_009487 [Edaphochlamys debaryana]|eukprot:KAG2492244.1 hypothetical protein HYH03_009487 [Edaphochlamys debaryana]
MRLSLYHLPPLHRPRDADEQACLEAALRLVSRLRAHGHSALFAGGWVRDQFLGRPSADIDIVTSATPQQVVDMFGPQLARLLGGVTCAVTSSGLSFEVSSLRGGSLEAADWAEWRDSAARDFTLNSLFFHPELPEPTPTPASSASDGTSPPLAPAPSEQPRGMVHDYVDGVADLSARLLRLEPPTLLTGYLTFSVVADPVRVFRAARLCVELGLGIDEVTRVNVEAAAGMCKLQQGAGPGDKGVTAGRVFRELDKMAELDAKHAPRALFRQGAGGGKGRAAEESEPGSPRFVAAMELCRKWGALEALFPGLDQTCLELALRGPVRRLPPDLPLELKLACLVVADVEGSLLPCKQARKYDPVLNLLRNAREAQPMWVEQWAELCGLLMGVHASGSTQEHQAWLQLARRDPSASAPGPGPNGPNATGPGQALPGPDATGRYLPTHMATMVDAFAVFVPKGYSRGELSHTVEMRLRAALRWLQQQPPAAAAADGQAKKQSKRKKGQARGQAQAQGQGQGSQVVEPQPGPAVA